MVLNLVSNKKYDKCALFYTSLIGAGLRLTELKYSLPLIIRFAERCVCGRVNKVYAISPRVKRVSQLTNPLVHCRDFSGGGCSSGIHQYRLERIEQQ